MHELSIVMGILEIANKYASEAKASKIDEIELDIGVLSTVEMNAFEFAWNQGIKNTMLEGSIKTINRIPGKASCIECNTTFPIENVYDPCPVCGNNLISILQGKELKVKSLIVT